MPKLPIKHERPRPTVLAQGKPVFVDVSNGKYRLRTAALTDARADVAAWLSDSLVVSALNGTGQAMTPDQLGSYISGFDNMRKNLVLVRTVAGDVPIGLIMFDIEPRHKIGSFHIFIGTKARRVGEASYAAVRLVLRHMFEQRGVAKVCVEPLSRNRAAVRSCEWLGFTLEGVLRSHRLDTKTGERLDQHVFAITRTEYEVWNHK